LYAVLSAVFTFISCFNIDAVRNTEKETAILSAKTAIHGPLMITTLHTAAYVGNYTRVSVRTVAYLECAKRGGPEGPQVGSKGKAPVGGWSPRS